MLTVSNLSKIYGETTALGGVSFHIDPLETTGIFGAAASGKTTLLDILSGYLLHYGGSVVIDGKDLRTHPMQCRRAVAYIPANGALYPDMTVREYISFVCSIGGMRGKKARKQAMEEMLQFCSLAAAADSPIGNLGAQERARVSIAAAMAKGPKLLLIDRPFFGLRTDEIAVHRKFLKAVAQKTTLVLASDSIHGFSDICKRTLVLSKGRVASQGGNLFAMHARSMRVRLRVACAPEQVRSAFQFISGVADLDFRSAPEAGVWDVMVSAEAGADIRKQLWFAAAASQVPVLEMRSMRISPEDVFLQLSGGGRTEGV